MDMLKKLRGIQLDRLTLYGKFTDKDKEYLMHMPNIGEICIKNNPQLSTKTAIV